MFCKGEHFSDKLGFITDAGSRKEILRNGGKEFLCLRGGNILKKCNQKIFVFIVTIQLTTQPCALVETRTLQTFYVQIITKPTRQLIYSKLKITVIDP